MSQPAFLQQKVNMGATQEIVVAKQSFEELKTFAFDFTKRAVEGDEPTIEELATMVAFFRAARAEGYEIHNASKKKPTATRKKTVKARAEAAVRSMSAEQQKDLLLGGSL